MNRGIEKRLEALEARTKAPGEYEDLRGLLVALGVEDPEPYRETTPGGYVLYNLRRALEDSTREGGEGA